jgi:hypothetical protein
MTKYTSVEKMIFQYKEMEKTYTHFVELYPSSRDYNQGRLSCITAILKEMRKIEGIPKNSQYFLMKELLDKLVIRAKIFKRDIALTPPGSPIFDYKDGQAETLYWALKEIYDILDNFFISSTYGIRQIVRYPCPKS